MFKIANAPCSWGVIENIEGERTTYETVIDEMQATGYTGTELGDWGFMPTDPQALKVALEQRELALLGSWVSVMLQNEGAHARAEAEAIRTGQLLAAVGGPNAVVVLGNDPYGDPLRSQYTGRITPELGMTNAQWDTFIAGANRVARAVKRETGLRSVFHHHTGTFIETPAETDRLLRNTDPEVLGLCFDTGHWMFGGGDPVAALEQYADRIWHVHFKDCEPDIAAAARAHGWDGPTGVGKGVFCELGQGAVDFPAIVAKLKAIGYDGWIVVEQDVLPGMGAPKESAARNRAYLRSIGL